MEIFNIYFSQSQIKTGDEIEVYMQMSSTIPLCPVEKDISTNDHDMFRKLSLLSEQLAWWPAHVLNTRGDYLVVSFYGIISGKDVVERSIVRLSSSHSSQINRKPLNVTSFVKRVIDIPPELGAW